jgi:1-acyl-sn-glycerol-3-phosphate acyltransferase
MTKAFCFFARKFIAPIVEGSVKETRGLENIPSGNFILASNHQSNFDHLFVPLPVKERLEKIHFIGKADNILQVLLAGWIYWLAGTIPVNRKAKDKRKVLEKAVQVLEQGEIIIIYPEGTRNRMQKIMEGKTGAVELAIRAKVPIVPLALVYKDNKPRKFPLSIRIGKPMYFDGELEYDNLRSGTERLMKEIYSLSI